MTEVISVYDDGVRLDIPFEACVLYHGRDSIGGLSLGYRLLRFALNKLTDGRIPERKEINYLQNGFPGTRSEGRRGDDHKGCHEKGL